MDDPIESTDGGDTVKAVWNFLRAGAQVWWEVLHAFDWWSTKGPWWRWRPVDTGSVERIDAVRAGTRKVGGR